MIKLEGWEQLKKKILLAAKAMPDHVAQALTEEAEIEMKEAKRRTPVDTGTLRASGRVGKPEFTGTNVSVPMTFGGAASAYALIVHEDLDAWHPVGQAKFLESTLAESAPHMAARVAKRLNIEELL